MPPTDEVYIWLGANTMLAYPTDEAETLLTGRLGDAKKSLENCEEDLEFLREQITVCHVCKNCTLDCNANVISDYGGCSRQGIQLGRCPEA